MTAEESSPKHIYHKNWEKEGIILSENMEKHIKNRSNPFRFTIEDFEFGDELGKGKFGNVYLAREKTTGFLVALKTMDKKIIIAENMMKQIKREVNIHSNLKHPNILSFYTLIEDNSMMYLVLQFTPNGTLYDRLIKKNKPYTPGAVAKYIHQVADAIDYCHSLRVIHRDIKPENILLDIKGKIKVSDFGWAVRIRDRKRSTMGGTLDYLPPEIISNKQYGMEVDNWSIGVLCYELLAGTPPFQASEEEETFKKILNISITYPINKIPIDAQDLIDKLLQSDPDKRISLENVKRHKWIKGYCNPT